MATRGIDMYSVDDLSFSHINPAYENSDDVPQMPLGHLYEDPTKLSEYYARIQRYPTSTPRGPRKKTSEIYEPTGPLGLRTARILGNTGSDTTTETSSSITPHTEPCLNRLVLFLILVVSITALVLVVLLIFGKIGASCGSCSQKELQKSSGSASQEGMPSVSLEPLQRDMARMNNSIFSLQQQLAAKESNISLLTRELASLRKELHTTRQFINSTNSKTLEEHQKTRADLARLWAHSQELWNQANETVSSISTVKEKITQLDEKLSEYTNRTMERIDQIKADMTAGHSQIGQNLIDIRSELNQTMEHSHVVSVQLNRTANILETADESLSSLLLKVNASLSQKLDYVSKMEGPMGPRGYNGSIGPQGLAGAEGHNGTQGIQGPMGVNGSAGVPGPPGAGNLALCQYSMDEGTKVTSGASAHAVVSRVEGSNERFMGVYCSTDRAALVRLETTLNNGLRVFVCQCYGDSTYSSLSSTTKCFIHYWHCPRTS
ncbi:predicted protein [Nematostella vectensis]|uniref:Scavenger receptor class A member 5 n=1 Tax=Nematostella vectensis TaxID=45351 RepID=A7SR56_NEMVE|nr:predicted protein [Nematostella vectensis]|eukprot:XP_001625906.1 predicted protein [Nematostella vectensis]